VVFGGYTGGVGFLSEGVGKGVLGHWGLGWFYKGKKLLFLLFEGIQSPIRGKVNYFSVV
jgi:hypothetical protein